MELLNKLDGGWCWMVAHRSSAEEREKNRIGCWDTGDEDPKGENTYSYAGRARREKPAPMQVCIHHRVCIRSSCLCRRLICLFIHRSHVPAFQTRTRRSNR